jgi:hypothetical protein
LLEARNSSTRIERRIFIRGRNNVMSDESAVQPSPQLIAKLQRKLHDPSIVQRFEARRKSSDADLIRPHWTLCSDENHRKDSTDGLSIVPKAALQIDCSSNADKTLLTESAVINAIPRRNYIDLRLEQNKLFADERYQQYINLCADWKDTNVSAIHGIKASEKRSKQWDTMQSCITEGLAAYPDHKGLLGAQVEMKQLSNGRREAVHQVVEQQKSAHSSESNHSDSKYHVVSEAKQSNLQFNRPRKGAEGRAHAAMRDALMERSFLASGAATGDGAGAGGYSLLPEVDETMLNPSSSDESRTSHKKKNKKHDRFNGSSEESNSSEGSYRRRRKEKKRKRDKCKKRKHKHDKKRHKKSRKRSRSSSVPK